MQFLNSISFNQSSLKGALMQTQNFVKKSGLSISRPPAELGKVHADHPAWPAALETESSHPEDNSVMFTNKESCFSSRQSWCFCNTH